MSALKYLFVLLHATLLVGLPPPTRIVGGSNCKISEIPYLVSFHYRSNFQPFCSGTLITTKWILTAAHCLPAFLHVPSDLWVVAGATDARTVDEYTQINEAESVYLHSEYSKATKVNDIGMVKLAEAVKLSEYVKLVELPPWDHEESTGKCNRALIAGWGRQEAVSQFDHHAHRKPGANDYLLKCAEVDVVPRETCVELVPFMTDIVSASMLCAMNGTGRGPDTGGVDACFGDSGGPLITVKSEQCPHSVQIGIVSSGTGCAMPNIPGFYTDVVKFKDFINQTMSSVAVSVSGSIFLLVAGLLLYSLML